MRTFTGTQLSPPRTGGSEYSPLSPEMQLLDKVETKDDFSQSRWRCIYRPERAIDTLSATAILEVGIMSGRDLLERDSSMFNAMDPTADAGVQIFLDDLKQEKCRTVFARGKQDPIWKCQCEVEIVAPSSMVRLQVLDDRPDNHAEIGFVEFCVGDLPFDQPIEGWFELRFQENMTRNSVERYRLHSLKREEVKSQEAAQEAAASAAKKKQLQTQGSTQSLGSKDGSNTEKKVFAEKEVFAKTKTRAMGAFDACIQSTADKAGELGFDTLSDTLKFGRRAKERNNAGELYITLRLKKVVSGCDNMFALALNPPAPVRRPPTMEVEVEEKIDVQRCWDELMDVRYKLYDDAVLCVHYWFKYMVTWRSSLLSFVYLVGFLTICWHSYTMWAIAPVLISISLIVNQFPAARMYMTRGGTNSPLNDSGFQWTAGWRSTEEMMKFVDRLVQKDIKGKVTDQQKLRTFSARCMRNGVPTVSLEDLRAALRVAPFIRMDDAESQQTFSRDDVVWIDERDRGRVVQMGPEIEKVTVVYEDISSLQPVAVERNRVTARTLQLPGSSKLLEWFPSQVEAVLHQIYPTIENVKQAAVPAIQDVTKILTWEKYSRTLAIVIVLLLLSALFSWAAILFLLDRVSQHGSLSGPQEIIVLIIRNIDNAVVTIITLMVLVLQSWWFASFRSVLRILSRCGHRRTAPKHWAFFRQDQEHQIALQSMAAQAARENPHGMFHLPYMAGDTTASYAAASTNANAFP
eukprot:gb/GFBE01078507.1/.p1 GENE.gb/GFBE01078507.1/~~gb/GFBE01078507.1/.p1  ORF type:complete len:746 (+),score=144.30 gb/GFBE01078507.1/:1-2238(+)